MDQHHVADALLRDSDVDAGLYWFARMLNGGEDPRYIARRLVRFAVEDIGIADPSALAFSPGGQTLFVASATGRAVTTIQVATGDRSALACDCSPSALIRMGSVFRLNELGSEPLWLLDTASDRGLIFVPAPAAN